MISLPLCRKKPDKNNEIPMVKCEKTNILLWSNLEETIEAAEAPISPQVTKTLSLFLSVTVEVVKSSNVVVIYGIIVNTYSPVKLLKKESARHVHVAYLYVGSHNTRVN